MSNETQDGKSTYLQGSRIYNFGTEDIESKNLPKKLNTTVPSIFYIMAAVAGNINITPVGHEDGDSIIIPVIAGYIYPIQVKKLFTTGTTATGIVLIY